MALTGFKLVGEATVLLHGYDRKLGELKRTALLLRGQLLKQFMARLGVGAVGGLLLPLLLSSSMDQLSSTGQLVFLAVSALALLLGELLERMLFFKALSAPKMPGAIA
jgi:DMSO reductase anchor subunit